MSKKSQFHPFKTINILISLIIISQKKMFNIEKVGEKIAVISNSTRYKRKNKIYLNKEKLTGEDAIKESDLIHIEAGEIMLSPDKDVERTTMYVCGSAGSGKSYFVAQYCEQYHTTFKNNPIFLVSENDEDPAFDKKDYIKRIDITDIHENPIDWKEFNDCLVVFDDIDSIKGKNGKTIDDLRDKLLKNSRKAKVSVISTSHDACGIKLKSVLNESKIIVFFLMNYNRSLKYLLENYLGLEKKAIEKLKKTTGDSRWTAFVKAFPSYLVQQKMISTIPRYEE